MRGVIIMNNFDKEYEAYLDWLETKMAEMDDDELIYSTGHFDEQIMDQYYGMTDEDGEYIHKYTNLEG